MPERTSPSTVVHGLVLKDRTCPVVSGSLVTDWVLMAFGRGAHAWAASTPVAMLVAPPA
ncbi:hypothetical protein AB0D27_40275 [Streptomyces sp. NPDC048415]|uniref:hypothetical protein n=1 Tax=Streptomyces sp. NPDC048415 TaxID=3154822 RepID=UPI00342E3DDC